VQIFLFSVSAELVGRPLLRLAAVGKLDRDRFRKASGNRARHTLTLQLFLGARAGRFGIRGPSASWPARRGRRVPAPYQLYRCRRRQWFWRKVRVAARWTGHGYGARSRQRRASAAM